MNTAAFLPETFGLIDEYYIPSILADAIADAVCPLLPSLTGTTGVVRALEPSPGIGHLVRAFSGKRWIADPGSRQQGTFNLIVSNPPYGERGAAGPGPGGLVCEETEDDGVTKSAHSEDHA